jgi:GWxTD domain-containing protein
MRLLEAWVQTPLAAAVGWALLHSLWEGAIVAAALAAVLSATPSPRTRYAAACVATLAMLAAFGLTWIFVMPDGAHGLGALRVSPWPDWNVRPGVHAPTAPNSGLAAIVPWLAPLWIAGVWIFYLRHAAGWILAFRMRRRGVCLAPERWQRDLSRLCDRLRVSRPVLLLESCMADAPMVLGHFRPLVLMPIELLTGLPAAQIEAILVHELAHIRRCDYLVNVLQRFVEGLFFYHPAVWWMARVIRAERENCCDDVVVATCGNAHEYAVALAALEQNRGPGREAAVAASGGSLMKRIRRLLYPARPNGAWTPLFAALTLIVVAAVTLAAWQAVPPPRSSADALARIETDGSPYVKWVNEDVVYIIANRERAAFLSLTTDDERKMFIEQFWQRRDPAPGAVENAFKKEHYRRIAYANKHFAGSGDDGWRTDRGHMYIVYGPPDEIEYHAEKPYPFEVWRYYHVDGRPYYHEGGRPDGGFFTFIDRTGEGDLRLAPSNAQ